MIVKKFKNRNFEALCSTLAKDHDPAKVPKIQNWAWWYFIDWTFHPVDKTIFYIYSRPVTDQQPKNVLPISVATRNFLFIFIFGGS
jgi:hypothetical protein